MLQDAIGKALKKTTHHPELQRVMDYAVFPAGKLFRPRLVEALALDLSGALSHDHLQLAAAIELHHAYTLVHDDLPAMDNDLMRRGKASTHAQFGEWKAILAGDALLISSFSALSEIHHKNFPAINRLMIWATGAKGLIEGQFRDLEADGKLDIADVVRIHELKTARLIQLATLGSYLLTDKVTLRGQIDFLRLGREIGVSFQLLDDLNELTVTEVSSHEKKINPFLTNLPLALMELRNSHGRLTNMTFKHRLLHVERMLQDYFLKNQKDLLENFSNLERNIGQDLSFLRNWVTTFV